MHHGGAHLLPAQAAGCQRIWLPVHPAALDLHIGLPCSSRACDVMLPAHAKACVDEGGSLFTWSTDECPALQAPAAKRHKAQASVVDITGDAAEEDTAMDIDAGRPLWGFHPIRTTRRSAQWKACHSAMAAPAALVTCREPVQSEEWLRDGLQLCMQLLVRPTEHIAQLTLKR